MRHTGAKVMGRLGGLAVGLGIGAALVATSQAADADSDVQVSIDGFDLFPTAGNSAIATSGMGDIAIAVGANSEAAADGGFGDIASAWGPGALAGAGEPLVGASDNNFDVATAVDGSAYAGNLSDVQSSAGSSFDAATAVGGAFADAGLNGSGDFASAFGPGVYSLAGLASAVNTPANFDVASAVGNLLAPSTLQTSAAAGGFNFYGGSDDLAFVFNPVGAAGSSAAAGGGNSFDLAGAVGDHLNAVATGADYVVQILPLLP